MSAVVEVPPVVREKALAVEAAAWLETLPLLVRSLEAEWRSTVGRARSRARLRLSWPKRSATTATQRF
jgi:hypothetical protein